MIIGTKKLFYPAERMLEKREAFLRKFLLHNAAYN